MSNETTPIPQEFLEEIKRAYKYLHHADYKAAFRSGAEWAYRHLSASAPSAGWVSVEDKPGDYDQVLLYFEGLNEMCTGFYIRGKWLDQGKKALWAIPTHWRLLPSPPSAGSAEQSPK